LSSEEKGRARVLIDGDACPVRAEAARLARRYGAAVVCFVGPAQAGEAADWGQVVRVSGRRDAADFAMAQSCRRGDVVVTDDLGLVALALARGAEVLSSRGRRFAAAQVPALLERRHLLAKARRAGRRTPAVAAMTPADRRRFVEALSALLRRRLRQGAAQEGVG